MSWLQRLYQTYEAVSNNPEVQAVENTRLMPYYHVQQNVQIIITINDKGSFLSAKVCRDKNDKVKSQLLTIPANNASANRTSAPVAHPLCDKLQYVAKDFFNYAVNAKADYFELYEQSLSDWCNSEFSHPKIQAVLTYVSKGTLVQDLIKSGVLIADETGQKLAYPSNASDYPESIIGILNKNKGVFDQGMAFVAWEVVASDVKDTHTMKQESQTWQDETLFKAWQGFYENMENQLGLCVITGEPAPLASKHPNRILRSATNAKLISANDMTGYTFLGRFTDTQKSIEQHGLQSGNISSIVTEKAHAALSWLLARQKSEESGQAIIAWALSGTEIPQPTHKIPETYDVTTHMGSTDEDSFDTQIFEMDEEPAFSDFGSLVADEDEDDQNDAEQDVKQAANTTLNIDSKENEAEPIPDHSKDIGMAFARRLKLSLNGYRQQLKQHEQISVISLEAATPGRVAVTYYHEALQDEYIANLTNWYNSFSWYFNYFDKKTSKHHLGISSPTPYQIAQTAYGTHLSDTIKKQVVSQVLPCIVEGKTRQLPYQLFELCFKRACNPLWLEKWEWEQTISTACALYKGYHQRMLLEDKKRSYTMALEKDYTNRDYLYGRLLALAEDIENEALEIAREKRNTTAQRYMQQFANRPFDTWLNIELALKPYENRLKSKRPQYLKNRKHLIAEIMSLFNSNNFKDNSPLSGEFLLGYHSQKMDIYLQVKVNTVKKQQTSANETDAVTQD